MTQDAARRWPVRDVMVALIDAAQHLLADHECDHEKCDEWWAARDAGVEWLDTIGWFEPTAELEQLRVDLPCGHRKKDHDNGYGDCTACPDRENFEELERENERLRAEIGERDALH